MVLLCAARFGNSPQKILIDAAWINALLSSIKDAPICALLALDGSLRLAATGSTTVNRSLVGMRTTEKVTGKASALSKDGAFEVSDEYIPLLQFEFNSSISTDVDSNSPYLYLFTIIISFV